MARRGYGSEHEWWLVFTNYSNSSDYVDYRRFVFFDAPPAGYASSAIYRHLRNAFVKQMRCKMVPTELEWTVRMLRGLENTPIESLEMPVSVLAGRTGLELGLAGRTVFRSVPCSVP